MNLLETLKGYIQTEDLYDLQQLAKRAELSEGAVLDLLKRLEFKLVDSTIYACDGPQPESRVDLRRRLTKLNTDLFTQKQLVKELHLALEQAESRKGVELALGSASSEPILQIKAHSDATHEATVLLMASDWHVGERVDSEVVNNLNEYTPAIATERAARYFANAVRLIQKEDRDTPVKHVVLWLGGDLITGYIHEELEESNYLSPTEELVLAQELISNGLDYLIQHLKVESFTVVCSYGNHGRTTRKSRLSTGAKNSYEWLMYQQLALRHPQLRWQIAEGYFEYLQVYDKVIRFHHGDNVRYQGGVGGITVPLMKFINRANTQQRADLDVVGHFHTLTHGAQYLVNGSLIGPSAYSVALGYCPERPQQGFQVIHSRYGFTATAPILVGED